jgi:elongation factor G
MASPEVQRLRNLSLVGHGSTGKTSLTETMLFKAGAIKRRGRVEEGSTVADHDAEEKDRKFSIDSALVHFPWKGKEFQVLDAPGYPDFLGAATATLRAVETAIVVVGAHAGVAVNTRKVWEMAGAEGLARILVVNRIDNENVNIDELLASIRESFGDRCIPVNLPIGQGPSVSGVVSALTPPASAPADVKGGDPAEWRQSFVEAVVEADDAALEKYLGEGTISDEEFQALIPKALVAGKVFPVLFTSAEKDLGVGELLDFLGAYAPSPAEGVHRKAKKGEEEVVLEPDPAKPFVAQVFKSVTDPFVGKMTYFRVFSGTIESNTSIFNPRHGRPERIGNLLQVQGKETKNVERVTAGMMAAVAKVENVAIGDTLCPEKTNWHMPPIPFPRSMVSVSVEPKSRADEQKIWGSILKIADEDHTFQPRRDAETHELVITGLSNLHLDVALHRLKRRYQLEVITHVPKIAYRETISRKSEARYRHKKQTGGRGQFGEVAIRIEPQERGKGFEFVDGVVGGSVPNQFIPAVEKGIREILEKGAIKGYRVVDVRVELWDGKDHPVDSSEQAFKTAARMAFRQAMAAAGPVFLEPVMNLEITTPSRFMGDITGDLNSRRGRIQGMDSIGNDQIIKATVPLAEVMTYSTELRSMTGGESSYTMEFSHYDVVPSHMEAKIPSAAGVHAADDEE